MHASRGRTLGQRTNDAVRAAAQRVDDDTGQAADGAAQTLTLTVRLLRIPTLGIGLAPLPFIAAIVLMGAVGSGTGSIIAMILGAVMAMMCALFFWRRRQLLRAVDDPAQLATELAIMAGLAGKDEDTRGVLDQIAGDGGVRAFSRMRGLWSQVGQRWIRAIGDLPRAKWFGPPRIGSTVTVTLAALWLIPLSVVVCALVFIATVAGAI